MTYIAGDGTILKLGDGATDGDGAATEGGGGDEGGGGAGFDLDRHLNKNVT